MFDSSYHAHSPSLEAQSVARRDVPLALSLAPPHRIAVTIIIAPQTPLSVFEVSISIHTHTLSPLESAAPVPYFSNHESLATRCMLLLAPCLPILVRFPSVALFLSRVLLSTRRPLVSRYLPQRVNKTRQIVLTKFLEFLYLFWIALYLVSQTPLRTEASLLLLKR